jgi:predicted RNase H-like HicB family nuclease
MIRGKVSCWELVKFKNSLYVLKVKTTFGEIMNNKSYPIIIEQDEDGIYILSCPILKGCHSYGATIDEAMDNIKEAIELCLEDEPNDTGKFIGYREIQVPVNA